MYENKMKNTIEWKNIFPATQNRSNSNGGGRRGGMGKFFLPPKIDPNTNFNTV